MGHGIFENEDIGMGYEIFENEIVMLLIGVGVLIFILGSRSRLKRLPASNILIVGFYILLAGWVLTVLEGFFWEGVLNYLEHLCNAVSSVLVAVWCWKVFGGSPRESLRRKEAL
jgi:MFS superfamily sulfate permease-like transporter